MSMDSQFHKQTVVDTQWNLIQPFKVGNSDNATMWTNLMVIILREINQTKIGITFCFSGFGLDLFGYFILVESRNVSPILVYFT